MSILSERIAIVSLAGRFPGAGADLERFWRNVAAGTDASTDVPAGRWTLPPERCTDTRIANPDTVYTIRGYYLEPFAPDLTDLALDPALIDRLDPLVHLVLDVGNRAWRQAKTAKVDRQRVGIVLGNICLPTDRSSDLCREILGKKLGLTAKPTHPLNRYVAGLPAGLLAQGLGLGGGSYTLDAACASSLYAVKLACDELLAHRADAMLAGGCARPDCQYTQMGFAQLRALSTSGRCSPFDARGDGLMVGEGAGVFVLKRLTDALQQRDAIHAVIAGIGLSNDMHGNLLAPAKEGQLRAMRRAYERAGWQPYDVEVVECHATGTPVGDAVEFESLRELWGEAGWVPGQCAIGSVKSTVGHLLTGAGAAAIAKVVLAMKAETLPPQANFTSPAHGLRYERGPFRVLGRAERWNRRGAMTPRRAAVSGFGFGGVNAHLLLEEWTGIPTRRTSARGGVAGAAPKLVASGSIQPRETVTPPPRVVVPVAIVGLAAHFGPWSDLRQFQERVFGAAAEPKPKVNGWSLAAEPSPAGYGIEELKFPIDRFRIPPKELEETLPQQLLMLQVAAAALDDAANGRGDETNGQDRPSTGAFIGLGLDPNTMNYHLRWSCLSKNAAQEPSIPPLTANRTMGALGSVAASRIARAFHFGGPSHTVCSEEGSAARALELGVRALQSGELDRALVGGVDLAADPRLVHPGQVHLPGEGAAAFVLKRLSDAERDGDRIYAIVRGVGVAGDALSARARAAADAGQSSDGALSFDTTADVGHTGAASAAASLAKACVSLWQQILLPSPSGRGVGGEGGSGKTPSPPTPLPEGEGRKPRYWLHDRAEGPRRAVVTASGADSSHFAILLQEHVPTATQSLPARRQPLEARNEAVFVVEGPNVGELSTRLAKLKDFATKHAGRKIEALARAWFREVTDTKRPLAVSMVARSIEELRDRLDFALQNLHANPTAPFPTTVSPAHRDRVFFAPTPLGPKAKIAFVYPGSGNQFLGMGRDLTAQWPDVLRRQQSENERLRSQFAPDSFWDGDADAASPRDLMFGQVTVGSLVSDVLRALGVRCDAMIGLSLGESAGLFGVRAWAGRDEMFRRMQVSTLFVSDLAPPYNSARLHWGTPEGVAIDWVSGVIATTPDDVAAASRPGLHAYLLIVNTPDECVIGGERSDVEKLAATIGKPVTFLTGVTLAHCEAGRPVEVPYRELHTLPTTVSPGVMVYSGAWGKSYKPSDRLCAESILAGLLGPIDVPRVVEAAYRDGVRAFVDVGPGNSCVRTIDAILGDRPHLVRAVHAPRQDAVSQVLRLMAQFAAERLPVDLGALYGGETYCIDHREPVPVSSRDLVIPVGLPPFALIEPTPEPATYTEESAPAIISSDSTLSPSAGFALTIAPTIEAAVNVQVLTMQAQETFLRINQQFVTASASLLQFQTALLEQWARSGAPLESLPTQQIVPALGDSVPVRASGSDSVAFRSATGGCPVPAIFCEAEGDTEPIDPDAVPRALTYEQCCAFAAGKVGDVLGPRYAAIDAFPTRVRLPDGPLQLVDRILQIEGEPLALGPGRVVTEHTVRPDRWYLDAGRIPTAIAVESGQADLFLSGFLGIDLQTRGLAVYRLLDAVVSFHRALPAVGDTIVYDIHIDEFVQQGDAWLFRFRFDGTVLSHAAENETFPGWMSAAAMPSGQDSIQKHNPQTSPPPTSTPECVEFGRVEKNGESFITMRNGVAGFFTAEALAAGKGIVQTALDRKTMPGTRPADWRELVPQRSCSLSADQVESLRQGDLVAAFGTDFAAAKLSHPAALPGGMLRLVDRVPLLDPAGGRFSLGFVRAEFDIHPDDWFLTCHFVDDMVMPGTLMYECCLHTLRIFLMRMGWVGEEGAVVCEPVPGVNSRLKCRGQVIAGTRTVTYEVTVKELGYRPEPYCLADALMYADGKPIVEITNMSLRMSGLTRDILERTWSRSLDKPTLYDSTSILAFSNGNPSEAFGAPYRVFDRDRVIARLPGPPYQFLDRITAVTGEPFVMKSGARCEAQYEVPTNAWYFTSNRSEVMPFAVLLEIALQPCGWLAAYCGSALTSPIDLSFRNLGGTATQHRPATAHSGTLTAAAKLTSVSSSAGMIIQHYDMRVSDADGDVYTGTTYFGFFSKEALANQVGLREAKVPWPDEAALAHAERTVLPHAPPFPGPMLRMIDRIAYHPEGGARGLGLLVGTIAVDPSFWFFQAHFYQDPVWPGSLGLESFLQLLKYAAWRRWGNRDTSWQTPALASAHRWVYRGQVLPTDREVTVLLEVTAVDDARRRLTADGFLVVDGRVIYQMNDFTLE